jgi:hypothetical protein
MKGGGGISSNPWLFLDDHVQQVYAGLYLKLKAVTALMRVCVRGDLWRPRDAQFYILQWDL